ncbi:MAG: radical SAM protein [Candidatus Omnitrophota bacterium]
MRTSHVVKSAQKRALLALGKRTPLRVTQAITYRCNLQCRFCEVSDKKMRELSTAEIKEAMLIFKQMGCIGWGFTGGEPLLREDLVELLRYAKECHFATSLVTNGTLTQKVALLEKELIDFVMLSLDGDRESMERIRGKGTYDKVLAALAILSKKNIKTCLSTIVDGYSQNLIKHVIQVSKEYGVFSSFQPIFDWQTGREDAQLLSAAEKLEQYRKNIDYLIAEKKGGARIWNSLGYLRYIRDYGAVKKGKCYAGLLYVMMDPQGLLHNCWWQGNKVHYQDVREAFAKLPHPPKSCYCFPWCHKEYSEVFSLRPQALWNTLKQL